MKTQTWSRPLATCCVVLGVTAALVGLEPFPSAQESAPPGPAQALAGLKYRELGPAIMGGRVSEFAVVESDPKIVYAALASGGVWKTVNAGTTWEPLFDRQAVSSIGAIAVAPANPSIVWVGTGEENNRQSSSWGNGIYKSTDAGRTWQHLGLADSHHIGRVAVHPTNPDVVFVAAMGRLWGANAERGLYKTSDGGKTWQHVIAINDDTGVADVVIDPMDPQTVYAASYQRRRTVFGFNGGGPFGAVFKSTDGGSTWRKLTRGLPYENDNAQDGRTGRIGLAIYRRNPSILYAIVEHANGGVFRSEDKGETWTRMSDIDPRPPYFSDIYIDPTNDQRIWVLGVRVYYSENGGKTFDTTHVGRIHTDFHALWINPRDPNHMLMGTDGGIHWSWDYGKTWEFVNTLALGQFYEVGYDMQRPYRITGGLQDNGSWIGPSMALYRVFRIGITNTDWIEVGGSDGYFTRDRSERLQHRLCGAARRRTPATRSAHVRVAADPAGQPRRAAAQPLPVERADRHLVAHAGPHLLRVAVSLSLGRSRRFVDANLSRPHHGDRPALAADHGQAAGSADAVAQLRRVQLADHDGHQRIAGRTPTSSGWAPTTGMSR